MAVYHSVSTVVESSSINDNGSETHPPVCMAVPPDRLTPVTPRNCVQPGLCQPMRVNHHSNAVTSSPPAAHHRARETSASASTRSNPPCLPACLSPNYMGVMSGGATGNGQSLGLLGWFNEQLRGAWSRAPLFSFKANVVNVQQRSAVSRPARKPLGARVVVRDMDSTC